MASGEKRSSWEPVRHVAELGLALGVVALLGSVAFG